MIRPTIFFLFFLCLNLLTRAQTKLQVEEKITHLLTTNIDAKEIKDSIALYTFSIKISLKKTKGKAMVDEISWNDPMANLIFKDINILKQVDYKVFLLNKSKTDIIIPVAYIVANYKTNDIGEKKISIIGLQESLYKLFNCTSQKNCMNDNINYLRPMIITVDKAIYD
ncbi:MAG: hypothetical protein V4546_01475 [Bacteroidota bacterium]